MADLLLRLRDQLAAALTLAAEAAAPLRSQLTTALSMVNATLAIDARVRSVFIDLRYLLAFALYYIGSERYERYEVDKCLRTTTGTLRVFFTDEKAGGKTIPGGLRHPRYKLLLWEYPTPSAPGLLPAWDGEGPTPSNGVLIADYLRTGLESVDPTASNTAGTNKGIPFAYTLPPVARLPDIITTIAIVPCDAAGNPVALKRGAADYESVWTGRFWVNRMGQAKTYPYMVVENGSYDATHDQNVAGDGAADGGSAAQWQVLPTSLAVTSKRPLPARKYVPFGDFPAKVDMFREQIVPHIIANGTRPCFHSDGRITTNMRQGYFIEHARMKFPPLPNLPGPRNVGTCYFPTGGTIGHNGGSYSVNPWTPLSHFTADEDRVRIILVGHYHVKCPDADECFNGTTPHSRLAGDWSRIPLARRGSFRVWGGCWIASTIVQGPPTNEQIGGESVHSTSPTWIWCDGHNRMLAAIFNGADENRGKYDPVTFESLAEPPIIVELTPPGSILDGWNIDELNGYAYIAERGAHHVPIWKLPTTAEMLAGVQATRYGTLLGKGQEVQATALIRFEDEGIPVGERHYHRALKRSASVTLAQIQSLETPAPEGLRTVVDSKGKPFISVSGLATAQVRLFPCHFDANGALEKDGGWILWSNAAISAAGKSHFYLHSYSRKAITTNTPGFGPPWTMAAVTFSDSEQGWPVIYKPAFDANGNLSGNAGSWPFSAFYDSNRVPSGTYWINSGRGGVYCRNVYAMFYEIGDPGVPVMEGGGSDEGLARWSRALPTDVLPTPAQYKQIEAGAAKLVNAGLDSYWPPYSKFDESALPLPGPYASDPDIALYRSWEQRA